MKKRQPMKHIATVALMLNLGVAGVYAQQRPVKMTFSGTLGDRPFNILPNTVTLEQVVAGDGTLGPFTFTALHADPASPQPSSSCSPGPYFPTVAGAGVFRFQDGSLLTVTVTEGALCIDLVQMMGHLTESYQITGGTGRFKDASGTLTLTATIHPVLRNASVAVPLDTNTGEFEGTVSGVAIGEDGQDQRR
jgi:hypothetical protein